jgi:hypothetical protein
VTAGTLLLAALAVYGLHRLACWAEDRGHLYYRHRRGSSGTLTSAALEVQALFEPSKRHVIEELRREEPEADPNSGGLP